MEKKLAKDQYTLSSNKTFTDTLNTLIELSNTHNVSIYWILMSIIEA